MDNFIDPSKIEEFKQLQLEAKLLASNGDLKASLQKFELAKQICPTPKVLQRIEKLKACLKMYDPEKSQLCHLSNTSPTDVKNPADLKSTDGSRDNLQISHKIKTDSKILSDIQNIQGNQRYSEKRSGSSDLSPERRLKFKQLKNEAKELALAGKYNEAVDCFQKALEIYDCPNVKRYIKEIESVALANKETVKELEYQSTKKSQHASDSVQELHKSKHTSMQSVNTEELVKDTKNQLEENTSEVSPGQKSSCSEHKNESYIERKLDEVKIIYEEARELAADGKLKEALKLLKEAQTIHETQKVQKRIDKLEEILAAELNNPPEEDKWIEVTQGFSVYHEIYNKLYPYQREGVAWMWNLYKMGKGGVLGDDMGLGKTFQVIAFISGMIDADLVKHILIIMPVSLLKNWEKEFKKWCPGISVHEFHAGTKKERERNKLKVQRRGHVLLTSYGMVVNNVNILTEMDGLEFVWDYVILDEGHKIKNPTKTTKAVYDIPAKNRLVLTGTPIQNNLKELWSLYDFAHQGTLLGSLKTFKLQYETPITRSREKDATVGEKRLGLEMAQNLKALIKPYFLRRTKEEVWKNNDDDIDNLETQMENMKITQLNAKKNDLILWTYMSDDQITIYQDFLHSDAVKSILVSKRSPLVELTTLKKICDHPRLLSQRACFHLGLNGELQHTDEFDLNDESTLASSIDNVTDECLLKESGKLKLVIDLLEHLKETGHRTLVFSLSRKILDMIHRILVNKNWKVLRLDGTIVKTADREKRIMKFQKDPSYPVFLLTTQVGGVGITLTAADRVIIYDPSWNPATDAQAVDRAYRIGQERDVVVYRLITCGTVEEKIYRRQIFKNSITRQATEVADPYRYFSKQELRELFSLDNPRYSATQVQLHEMHSSQRSTYDELEKHLEFLSSLNIFGISDHDLMFSKQVVDNTEDNDPNGISEHFIKQKVAAAHAQIQMEANVVAEGIRLTGTYNRPYQEAIPLFKKNTVKDSYKPPVLPDVVDLTEDAPNDVFPSNTSKRSSYTSKSSNDSDIEIISSRSNNGSILNEEKHASASEKVSENIFPKSNKLLALLPVTASHYSNSENAVDFAPDFEKGLESVSFTNTEKLRKSSFSKQTLTQDKCDDVELLENPIEAMNLDETHDLNSNKQPVAENCVEPVASSALKAMDVTCDLKEKFQANLTHYMNDIPNLSFDEEATPVTVKRGRKSCVRQSTLLMSESDTSCQNSASNSLNLVEESEGTDDSDYDDDSSNSASVAFVPESATNTPQMSYGKGRESIHRSINQTPPINLEPQLVFRKNSGTSDLKKIEGSVRRITPLKIHKKQVKENSPFAQAMANSPLITPESSPKNEQKAVEINTAESLSSAEEEDDIASVESLKNEERSNIADISEHKSSDEEDDDIFSAESSMKNERIPNMTNNFEYKSSDKVDGVISLTKSSLENEKISDKGNISEYKPNEEDENVTPASLLENEHVPDNANISVYKSSVEDDFDSPIRIVKKRAARQINCDLDEEISDKANISEYEPNEEGEDVPPASLPENGNAPNKANISAYQSSFEDDFDSPIKIVKKRAVRQINSDSDESDIEKSLSNEEEEQGSSENDEDEEEEEIDSDNNAEIQDDLEQTFATCKDKNSESDHSSEGSNYESSEESEDDYSNSDESGSLFSEET